MVKGRPLKPSDVAKAKGKHIPGAVFDCFNRLVTINWNGLEAVVLQEDVLSAIMVALKIQRQEVFDRGLLDVEELYELAGWKVWYDKPGYNETYKPFFRFTRKPKEPRDGR